MQTDDEGRLTVVGLGPGTWEMLTMEAIAVLEGAQEVYVRTAVHPSIEPIRAHLPLVTFHSFDRLYETLPTLDRVYEEVAGEVAALARRPGGVVYAVSGSPSVRETTVRLLLDRLRDVVPVRLVQGVSMVEPVLAAAGETDAAWIEVVDASEAALLGWANAVGEVAGVEERLPWRSPVPTAPLIVSYLYDRHIASGVKLWLSNFYPDEHGVRLIHAPGRPEERCESIPLYELDHRTDVDHLTALYVPPLAETQNVRTFAGLMELTRTLRAPGGCPWDREQTHASLKPHLLEETYEVLDALDVGDAGVLAEELGDLLFQITIHSQVAAEAGEFTIEDVIESIMRKLIGRHPHVFGDAQLGSAQEVREAWESFKQREKPKRTSVLEQIPRGLPALPQSNLMQKRAASVGFEWPRLAAVVAKVEEELEELKREVDREAPKERQREEFGDILFALVSVARHLRLDPEEALRLANRKFAARFQYVETRVTAMGRSLRDLSAAELDALWEEAKALGTAYAG
ncbi:MAG: nucleoside triphosphate pyrophosphohydrolase [Chloroflexi bacterium]|nr:nucleoside triphosphate pyrophosphohydrolase [Chloroflexota bacterium]